MKAKLEKFRELYKIYNFDSDSDNLIDIIIEIQNYNNLQLLKDFCHFYQTHYPMSEDEEEKLYEVLDNMGSVIIESYNCSGYAISKSENVYNSTHVNRSKDIISSHNISMSDDIQFSKKVYFSTAVYNSSNIYLSSHISESKYIHGSHSIDNSSYVDASKELKNCGVVSNCSNSYNVYLSRKLKNCSNCIFCYDLEDKQFHIFNKPVTPKTFFTILSFLQIKYLGSIEIKDNEYFTYDFIGMEAKRFDFMNLVCEVLVKRENFEYDVRNLPNFNPVIAAAIVLEKFSNKKVE